MEVITLERIRYRLIRSRRKSITLQITPAGDTVLRCPMRLPLPEADRFVAQKREWILAHLPPAPAEAMTPAQLAELKMQARDWFPRRTAEFASAAGVTYGRITLRFQRSRWGSCSRAGNLNFNCLLMLAPPEVRDYVVVHELCHRKQMNHSPAFWTEVRRILPDYELRRRWLRENGASLLARLGQEQEGIWRTV